MDKNMIETLVRARALRYKQVDKEFIKSLLSTSERTSNFVKTLEIDEKSSDVIFWELYESVRQLGEIRWRLLGYEPLNHEICLDGLMDSNIKEKTLLNHLSRFKKIRNDLNYKGVRVEVSQEREIIDFWNKCGDEILELLKKEVY